MHSLLQLLAFPRGLRAALAAVGPVALWPNKVHMASPSERFVLRTTTPHLNGDIVSVGEFYKRRRLVQRLSEARAM